jgi:DNA end-binding protein Ku
MARSIWNGVITFGMVSIPVGMVPATSEKDLRFNQIHEACGSRIKQQKFCPVCERNVEAEEVQRGYEISKGSYAIVGDEDFEALPVPSKHTIEVSAFVKAEQVDPLYFDKSYYLQPSETGRKPLALLYRALQERGVSAIAKVALRQKEHMCLLRPADGALVLETLFYPDEIREAEDKNLGETQVDEKELKMAMTLVDLLEEEFEPDKFKDEYREALLERIEAKLHGGELREAPAAPEPAVYNLMDALKASLEEAQKRKKSG